MAAKSSSKAKKPIHEAFVVTGEGGARSGPKSVEFGSPFSSTQYPTRWRQFALQPVARLTQTIDFIEHPLQ
ncbi:hypothetical protein LJR220_000758 [Bradyrhizobium sp. LjRoot220]|uniref:hypothetical protein n=1 Tax=Bradyrhizobium sp. LjRoot220 TaxID=3342284 RepID=UPI003ECFA5B3